MKKEYFQNCQNFSGLQASVWKGESLGRTRPHWLTLLIDTCGYHNGHITYCRAKEEKLCVTSLVSKLLTLYVFLKEEA